MDVPVSTLRAELKSWIERVGDGETVVVTDRGIPVARLVGVESAGLLAELERDGLVASAEEARVPSEQVRRLPPEDPGIVTGIMRRLRR